MNYKRTVVLTIITIYLEGCVKSQKTLFDREIIFGHFVLTCI